MSIVELWRCRTYPNGDEKALRGQRMDSPSAQPCSSPRDAPIFDRPNKEEVITGLAAKLLRHLDDAP